VKLVVDLDGKINLGNMPKCIVLSRRSELLSSCHLFIPFDGSLVNRNIEIAAEINRLFLKLSQGHSPLINNAHVKVFKPICGLLYQMDKIISDYSISEIYIEGGCKTVFFAFEGGEGEGRPFMYQHGWLLNPIIYTYFNSSIRVNWRKKSNSIFLGLIFWVRNAIYFSKFIKRLIVNSSNLSYSNSISFEGIESIGFVSSDLQMNYLKKQLDSWGINSTLYSSAFSNASIKNNHIIKVNPGIGDYYNGFKTVFLFKRSGGKTFRFVFNQSGRGFFVDLKMFSMSMSFNLVEYYATKSSLLKVFNRIKFKCIKNIYSNMTFGQEIFLVGEVARLLEVRHINFQGAAMEPILLPNLHLADLYYLYNRHIFNYYTQMNSSFRFNSILFEKINLEPLNKECNTLTLAVFTQPDHYTDQYIDFIRIFISRIEPLHIDIHLIIKPHYRENRINDFQMIANNFSKGNHIKISVANNLCAPEEIIKVSSLIMSMTSSVLFEAVISGCPGIILGLNSADSGLILDIACPEVNFLVQNVDEVVTIVRNYPSYYKEYVQRRIKFTEVSVNFDEKV
jgi:hypothetical protein